jgi:cysteinyl-tRNA synthetase
VEEDVLLLEEKLRTCFIEAMEDDLNTADAIGAIFEYIRETNIRVAESMSRESAQSALEALQSICGILGILQREKLDIPEDVQTLLKERVQARAAKDWKASDALRDAIAKLGFSVEDTREGQKVNRL